MRLGMVAAMLLLAAGVACCSEQDALISGIRAFHWHGQTFVQWEEKTTPTWTTFNVYRADGPITSVRGAGVECLARQIIPRSGRSFYALKRNGYIREIPEAKDRYILPGKPKPGSETPVTGLPLPESHGITSVTGGIFVHTAARTGESYYAVTCTPLGQAEETRLVAGLNLLAEPIEERAEAPRPYLIASRGNVPDAADAPKMPLTVNLYAIAGTHDASAAERFSDHRTYLLWMPSDFGWREGLPTIFTLASYGKELALFPDDSNFAFMGFGNSWWFGYNSEIVNPDKVKDGVVRLYSQKKMLFILKWLFERYPPIDRGSVGVTGPSMGGTGALLFGLRHPEIFAWIQAWVPGGNVVKLPAARSTLHDIFGPLDADIKAETGESVWNELSNTWYVSKARGDLPFLAMMHGRHDAWMEWPYTVELYRELQRGRHAFTAWWAPAGHTGGSLYTIPTFGSVIAEETIRSDTSLPAISECSLNEDFGDGRPQSGDPYGGCNYQIRWKVEKDTAEEYAITFSSPRTATLEFTCRRLQRFRTAPGTSVSYQILRANSAKPVAQGAVKADGDGLVTIADVPLTNLSPTTVTLSRTAPAGTPPADQPATGGRSGSAR